MNDIVTLVYFRWLIGRGKVNEAVKVLRRFEKINKAKIPDDVMDEFIVSIFKLIIIAFL